MGKGEQMKLLRLIGVPFRFMLFILIHVVIGVMEPDKIKNLDEDWKWVLGGKDKYNRRKKEL